MANLQTFGLDVGIYGANATPQTVLRLATLAEEAGFGSIWLADHVAFPVSFKSEYPYAAKGQFPTKLDDPLLEPVATMGVLVGATKRVRIGVAVLIMPYRNPMRPGPMGAKSEVIPSTSAIARAGTAESPETRSTHTSGRR